MRAEKIFRSILERHPEQIEALARLGEVLLEKPERAPFLRWQATLPEVADLHPRTWYARGVWAHRNGQPRAAVRCFLEALRLHPNHARSNFQLSQVLISLGMSEEAKPFVERARLLAKLDFTLSQLQSLPDLELMRQVAEINEQLGCVWEVVGLEPRGAADRPRRDLGPAETGSPELPRRRLPTSSCWPSPCLHSKSIISQFPLPVWPAPDEEEQRRPKTQSAVEREHAQLVDVAQEAGISFQYFNTHDQDLRP